MILALVLAIALPLAALGTLAIFGIRFVRLRERDADQRAVAGTSVRELRRLEESVEAMQSEIAYLRQRQEFVERLLERPREPEEQRAPRSAP